MKTKRLFCGLLAKCINYFIPVKRKNWVFGADFGNMYREGSKYLLEYMLKEHPEYKCTFITQKLNVYDNLNKMGIPCKMNLSLSGILTIAEAERVFTTQAMSDIYFAYKKNRRCYYYLVHGMPLKIAQKALKESGKWDNMMRRTLWKRIKERIYNYIVIGYSMDDVSFVSATSDFLASFMQIDFGKSMQIKILGMPRNDALFHPDRMSKEKWVTGIEDRLVITYMPTHRLYGQGEITPTPFENRPDVQKWMQENNVVLLMKQHPNMIPKLKNKKDSEVIKDITKLELDPQVCIYHSDVLITDFSSVWMDYLLLRRPIIFYIYDDFEHDDVGTYYDIREDPPGCFCYSEDELFELIKRIKMDYDKLIPSERIVHKYHKYIDGNSCERYYQEITKSASKFSR